MFYCDAWNVSNERSYDANLVLVETINKQCNSKAEIRLISVFPREYEFKKKKKEEKKMGVYFGLVNYSMPTQFDWSENENLFKQSIYFFYILDPK